MGGGVGGGEVEREAADFEEPSRFGGVFRLYTEHHRKMVEVLEQECDMV